MLKSARLIEDDPLEGLRASLAFSLQSSLPLPTTMDPTAAQTALTTFVDAFYDAKHPLSEEEYTVAWAQALELIVSSPALDPRLD